MNRIAFAFCSIAALSGAATAQELSIATGGTGGTYYPYGSGFAQVIERHIEGTSVTVEVTAASVENLALLTRGETDIIIAAADAVKNAVEGLDAFEGRRVDNIAALGALYANVVQIAVLEESGIQSLDDLRNKRLSVGAPGSATELTSRRMLELQGITYEEVGAQRLSYTESVDAMRDGSLDAAVILAAPPASSVMALAAGQDISILPLTQEEVDRIVESESAFAPYVLRAGTYDGQDEDVLTFSTPNMLLVNDAMDEELAYQITRVLFEYTQEIVAVHPSAKETTVEFSLASSTVPLHPGARRYYEEVGAEIPARLLP
ncbi:TAXI family TRAP transporter solute-binding subunit [Pontivivens nitratireducens]|jgi:TRAP transporter TAXI family solute receptor|uniref:TAXI family TRAP transporter solute-binding subunit n=1 Tax=Pontivivens nitratireducens TaxID=2758038 RepID=A0A6G7VR84_9RHOB|nr:TAXI family TRAP transporter solute-binding subunit [Pontibrevibacter nitratireducens]QIK42521.1 TAXI family TRAP transporter solute-binding subunit [Pontibrevibacter nitratireducens]